MAGSWDGGSFDHGSQSDDSSYHFERLPIEPMYDAFLCPLTKQVMRDPVTLENGQTFEREAIEKWFKECKESGRKPICPLTLKELKTVELNPSIALRNTIEEWTARNEAAQLDMARRSLNLGSSESEVMQSLKYVQYMCQKSRSNKHVVKVVFTEFEDCPSEKVVFTEFEDCPSEKVVFTEADIAAGSKHWENALVGYVLGLKPTLAEMTCFAKTEWERFEVPKVLLLDDGVFLFAFESPDKKRIVWETQWAYSDHFLVLREWTCDLDVHNVEVLRRVPIWVEFPKLPLFLWNPKSLGRLAGHLGRPLATYKSTKNPQNQLKCARVLIEVEVNTMDKLPLSIPVDLPQGWLRISNQSNQVLHLVLKLRVDGYGSADQTTSGIDCRLSISRGSRRRGGR